MFINMEVRTTRRNYQASLHGAEGEGSLLFNEWRLVFRDVNFLSRWGKREVVPREFLVDRRIISHVEGVPIAFLVN